jgi:SAM-dependent methyltransferase
MNSIATERNLIYEASSFRRDDETPDRIFYRKARLVEHLDKRALRTVEHVIGTLIIEPRPRILDLMASWDSHIPDLVNPELVVGLGLNGEELLANPKLDLRIIQDINEHPVLPFPEASFDIVLNTVSVDYITKPLEVFSEVGRILRPGGLFLVIFSNRYFPPQGHRPMEEALGAREIAPRCRLFLSKWPFRGAIFFRLQGKEASF